MSANGRKRGRPLNTRLGEDLAALHLFSREGAQASAASLAAALHVPQKRALELLDTLAYVDPTEGAGPAVPLFEVGNDVMRRPGGGMAIGALRLTQPQAEVVSMALDQAGMGRRDPLRSQVEAAFFPPEVAAGAGLESMGPFPELEPGCLDALKVCARSLARAVALEDDGASVRQPAITFKYQGTNDVIERTRKVVPRALRIGDGHWLLDAFDVEAVDSKMRETAARTFVIAQMREPELLGDTVETVPINASTPASERLVRLSCTPEAAKRVLAWAGSRLIGKQSGRQVIEVPYYQRGDWLPRHVMALGREVSFNDDELAAEIRDIVEYDLRRERERQQRRQARE